MTDTRPNAVGDLRRKLSPCHPGLSGLSAACCNVRTGGPAIVTQLPETSQPGGESRRDRRGHVVRRTSERKKRQTAKVCLSGASWRGATVRAPGRDSSRTLSCGLPGPFRPLDNLRPFGALRPIVGEPLHRPFEDAGREVAPSGDVVEFGTTVQDERRDALAPYAGRLGISVCC